MVQFESGLDVWKRAIRRAQARPYQTEYIGCFERVYPIWYWRVSSNTTTGDWHSVSVGRMKCGVWTTTCDCHAGQRDVIGAHVALTLVMMGVLDPLPDPGAPAALPASPSRHEVEIDTFGLDVRRAA
jgi:hypothetical protein